MSAPPSPVYLTEPTVYAPAYATTNADGAIGNGAFSGSYMLVGNGLMRIWLALLVGGTTAPGTGELVIPMPPNWKNPDNVRDAFPNVQPFIEELGAFITRGAGVIAPARVTHNTFGVNKATLNGFVAEVTLAGAGDVLTATFDLPVKGHI